MKRFIPALFVLPALALLVSCESASVVRDPSENLLIAAETGDMDLFRRAILEGADVDACDFDGKTALILAAENNRGGVITNLLSGVTNILPEATLADSELRDNAGNTALLAAADKDCSWSIVRLLEYGADGEARTPAGETALMIAARRGFLATARVLADGGSVTVDTRERGILQTYAPEKKVDLRPVDLDARDRNGRTALMKAVEQGRYDVANLLLQRGADTTVRDRGGMTALDWARYLDQVEMESLLLDAMQETP
jgi:ankyrin repeat protein